MEKSLPLLLVGLFIVPRRLIQRFQELFAAFLSRSSTQHYINKHLHRLIVRDDLFVIMCHKKSPPYDNLSVQTGFYFKHSNISSLSLSNNASTSFATQSFWPLWTAATYLSSIGSISRTFIEHASNRDAPRFTA